MASAQLSSLRRAGAGSDLKETALAAPGAQLRVPRERQLFSRCLWASPEIWRTVQPPGPAFRLTWFYVSWPQHATRLSSLPTPQISMRQEDTSHFGVGPDLERGEGGLVLASDPPP